MSISDKLIRLQNAKTDIADAITENGGTVEDTDGLEEYPERITSRFEEVNNVLSILLKGPTLISKTITENGEYLAEDDNADGYSSVLVNVESYTIADAGKVVNSTGTGLVSQTAYGTVTTNGTIDTTLNNSVIVNVPTYSSADNGKVIKNGVLSSQTSYGTRTTNGTVNTTYNNSIIVNVPTYSASDAGKVVNTSGNLVAQNTGKSITSNGIGIDTTYYSSVDVNVPIGVDVQWLSPQIIVKSSYLTYFYFSGKLFITGYVEWKNNAPSYGTDIFFNFQSALSNIGLSNSVSGYIFNIPYDSGSFPNVKGFSSMTLSPSSTSCSVESAGTYAYSYITGFFE